MYYELYIDVFFIVNFTMDYLLLAVVRKMMKCSGSLCRVALGALAGSLLTCLIVAVPVPYAPVKFILFHGFVNIVMIITGFGIKELREVIKACLLLYVGGFLLGGVFQFFSQYVRTGSLFFALAVLSYYTVTGIWRLLSDLSRQNRYRCQVILCKNDRKCRAQALIDTGNCLQDQVTGKPVCIVDGTVVRELCGVDCMERIRYIPYHSIGKPDGVMPVIELDEMYVYREEKQLVKKPLIAVCNEQIAGGQYKVILNPDILTGGIKDDHECSSISI